MTRKKILVAEDGEFNRDLFAQLLEGDYEIVVAVDGEEAVRKAQKDKPDLILMDLRLPLLDEREATKRIRANGELRHIPVIAVTSHAMVGDEKRAREAGCDDYLSKPIDQDELLMKVRKFIK